MIYCRGVENPVCFLILNSGNAQVRAVVLSSGPWGAGKQPSGNGALERCLGQERGDGIASRNHHRDLGKEVAVKPLNIY